MILAPEAELPAVAHLAVHGPLAPNLVRRVLGSTKAPGPGEFLTLPVDRTALHQDGAAREPAGDRASRSDRAASRSPLSAGAAFAEPIADPS